MNMETRSRDQPVTRPETHRPASAAACEPCRRLKMRCIRPRAQENEPCDRCRRNDRPCRIPPPRPLGRKPGSVGRYRGLEKAYRRMQAELDKARASPHGFPKALEGVGPVDGPEDTFGVLGTGAAGENVDHTGTDEMNPVVRNRATDVVAHEPISNPLALLADASEAAQASRHGAETMGTSSPSTIGPTPESVSETGRSVFSRWGESSLGLGLSRETLEAGWKALLNPAPELGRYSNYFRPPENVPLRDVGPDLDPVELGLVTIEEVYSLFPIYFSRLHPVNGILDPMLHTPDFARSRSALLFTWILALTAQFDRGYVSMAKRLRIHGEKLSRYVHKSGFKSVEIVQGYYISLLSATPARSLAEERSWLYTMYAFGVAAELGLDQAAGSRQSSLTKPISGLVRQFPQDADCDTDDTIYSQRLARNRERTWLRILLWERANSAAYGRINSFPDTELTVNIKDWCLHPLSDPTDSHTCAFILLRRHLAELNVKIKNQATIHNSNPHWVRELIDSTLDLWRMDWLMEPNSLFTASAQLSARFLHYVYLHNRLWTLSFALNMSANGERELHAIRQDCFCAAIQICEVAVRDLQTIGEPLYCMLAPTWAMISYAAVLALKIFPQLHKSQPEKETELLALLAQVALHLERAGTTPLPRVGIAALLGQHLSLVLRAKARGLIGVTNRSEDSSIPGLDQGRHPGHQITTADVDPSVDTQMDSTLVPADPFLSTTMISIEQDFPGDGFTDLFREIFGPSFGDVF